MPSGRAEFRYTVPALQINSVQMARFKQLASVRFRDFHAQYLTENHGDALVNLDRVERPLIEIAPERLRQLVAGRIERGQEHGLSDTTALFQFVLLCFLVSPSFDQHPGIATALHDDLVPPNQCMKAIVASMTDDDWDEVRAANDASAWSRS
jgi:hypothetical protein